MPVKILNPLYRSEQNQYRDTKTNQERAFYSSYRWTQFSKSHRKLEPLCRECKSRGIIKAGKLTDHIVPISNGGNPWDESNLQTLCNECHNSKRQHERSNSKT